MTRTIRETLIVHVVETIESDDPVPPTPRRPALRVVTTSGETLSESTRPLARSRQVSPIQIPARKKVAGR
jgi:hypothetical protein